jgi:hypothetical protein
MRRMAYLGRFGRARAKHPARNWTLLLCLASAYVFIISLLDGAPDLLLRLSVGHFCALALYWQNPRNAFIVHRVLGAHDDIPRADLSSSVSVLHDRASSHLGDCRSGWCLCMLLVFLLLSLIVRGTRSWDDCRPAGPTIGTLPGWLHESTFRGYALWRFSMLGLRNLQLLSCAVSPAGISSTCYDPFGMLQRASFLEVTWDSPRSSDILGLRR